MTQAIEARSFYYYNAETIRVGIVQAMALVAKTHGTSVLILVEAISAGRIGPATEAAIDNFVKSVGIPRAQVLELLYEAMGKSEYVTASIVSLLAAVYGPDIPTTEQAAEIKLMARRLEMRAKAHWRKLEDAKELVRAAGGEIDVSEPE